MNQTAHNKTGQNKDRQIDPVLTAAELTEIDHEISHAPYRPAVAIGAIEYYSVSIALMAAATVASRGMKYHNGTGSA
jgi:hypothetical protein